VPRDLPAPVEVDHIGAVRGALMVLGELPGGVDAPVLEQQQRVRTGAGDHLGMQIALQRPGGPEVDGPRGQAELLVPVPTGHGFAETEAYHVEHRTRLLRPSPGRCGQPRSRPRRCGSLLVWTTSMVRGSR